LPRSSKRYKFRLLLRKKKKPHNLNQHLSRRLRESKEETTMMRMKRLELQLDPVKTKRRRRSLLRRKKLLLHPQSVRALLL
jgi:hypothetical protein